MDGKQQSLPGFFFKDYFHVFKQHIFPFTVEELMLTSGASAGLTLIVNILMDSNCVVFVESPTYFLVLKMLKDLGITNDRIVPVPMDADGMDVEYLEQKVQDQHYRYPELEIASMKSYSTLLN